MSSGKPKDPSNIDEDASTIVLHKRHRSGPAVAPPGAPSPYSVAVLEGHHRGEVIRLRVGDNIVGRHANAAIPLTDDGISRRHAIFVVSGRHEVTLFDINSTNGTTVNGKRICSSAINVGDLIRVGRDVVLDLRSTSHVTNWAKRSTKVVEVDAPIPRSLTHKASSADSFSSKRRAFELGSSDAKPCWGYSGGALEAYERLLRLREEKLGKRHIGVAQILDVMGRALQDDEQFERALSCYQRSEKIHRVQESPAHEGAACALARGAQCEVALGRNEDALYSYERAERLLVCAEAGHYELASVRLAIARLLWATKQDLERGLRLAREAEGILAQGGDAMRALHREAGQCVKYIEQSIGQAKGQRPRACAPPEAVMVRPAPA